MNLRRPPPAREPGERRRTEREARIRSCILVFFYGGPSHLDTWDYKPNAPREVRGEFGSIASSVPGIRVGEHMPHLSKVVDRLAIVRSMHHPMTNHNAAAFADALGQGPRRGDLLERLWGTIATTPPASAPTLSARRLPEVLPGSPLSWPCRM